MTTSTNPLTQYNELANALKSCGYNSQVWHSGGGIFGVLVTLTNSGDVFFGDAEGDDRWGYDYSDAEYNHVDSASMSDNDRTKWSVAEWAADVVDGVVSL